MKKKNPKEKKAKVLDCYGHQFSVHLTHNYAHTIIWWYRSHSCLIHLIKLNINLTIISCLQSCACDEMSIALESLMEPLPTSMFVSLFFCWKHTSVATKLQWTFSVLALLNKISCRVWCQVQEQAKAKGKNFTLWLKKGNSSIDGWQGLFRGNW